MASRGAQLVRVTPGSELSLGGPGLGALNQRLASLPWIGPALRLGVHVARELPDGALLAITSGTCWRGESAGITGARDHDVTSPATRSQRRWTATLPLPGFRRPARGGVLVDGAQVWLAQYDLNPARDRPIRLWRSDDAARTFQETYRFEAGDVRHIHFIQRDPFTADLWLGTGDTDQESRLHRSADGGDTWHEVAGGSQRYRATGLAFREEAIIWGTDAGSDAGPYRNRVLRLDRTSGQIEEVCWLQGPVHGLCATASGDLLVVTGLEGGVNEIDRRVHVWRSRDSRRWQEIASFAGGLQPRRAQYGVGYFPVGQQLSDTIWLGLRGVLAGDVVTLEATLPT